MKKILKYSLEGNFIETFSSAKSAAESVGLKSHSGIISCCRNYESSNSVGGFQWKYFQENFPLKIDSCTKRGEKFKSLYGKNSEGYLSLQEQKKKTSLEKFGTYHPMQNDEVKKNLQKSIFQKYGVSNAAQNPIISKKISRSERQRKSLDFFKNVIDENHKIISYGDDMNIVLISQTCGHSFNINRQLLGLRSKQNHVICTVCNKPESNQRSEIENSLYNSLSHLGLELQRNVLGLLPGRREIDLYFPDKNVAIEVNGARFHSELFGKGKNYHLDKTVQMLASGTFLFQFFDDEITQKPDIVLSMIKSKLGLNRRIYARKCEIRSISNQEALHFFQSTHIQGEVNGRHQYGLFYEGSLVSAMSFCKVRKSLGSQVGDNSFELLRFSSSLGLTIVGGFSKLLKKFIIEENPEKIISYANRRWSIATVYQKAGFELEKITPPGYYFFWKNKRVSRHKLNKKNLQKIYPHYTENASQVLENIEAYKIWDCGNYKFRLVLASNPTPLIEK